jgi:ATP-dependent Lon protease
MPIYTVLAAAVLMVAAMPAARAQAPERGGAADAARLPSTIPLFPLGDTVLFPGVTRPLLIFEPRYREMVADALKGDRIIGMVQLQPGYEKDYEGRPPIYDIGCAGEIAEYELLPDGRYTILLNGLTRFRVVSEDQRRAYRLARVEPMPEALAAGDLAPLSAVREQLTVLLLKLGVEPPPPQLSDLEFVHVTAQYLEMPVTERQALLERSSALQRARALVDFLDGR